MGNRRPARRPRSWALRVAAGLVVAVAVFVGSGGVAGAHAYLESSNPSQSEVLLLPPRQVVLHFDEPVEIDFGSVRVFGPDGRRVDQGGTHHPGDDTHSVAIPLPARLSHGTYVVAWRVISADSHPVHGAYLFSVGTAAGAARANSLSKVLAAASGSTVVGVLYGVVRFAEFAALLVVVGLVTMLGVVFPPGRRIRRLRRIVWASWFALFVATVAAVAVQGVYAATLPLSHVFSPSLFDEVLHTHFGEVQVLRAAVLVLTAPVLYRLLGPMDPGSQGRSWPWPLWAAGAALGVGLLLTPGLGGHAASSGTPVVGETLDVFHLAGAAVWIGGLVLLATLLVPGIPDSERPASVREVARRFSPYGVGAVAVVVTSGTLQSIRQVGSFYALLHTVYGRTLVVKVALVVLVVLIAAVSRRLVLGRWTVALRRQPPTLGAGAAEGTGRQAVPVGLRRTVLAECTVVVAVLVATALLVNAAPARQAAAQPFSQSFQVLGNQVNVIVAPAHVGAGNQVHVYILGRLGQPVAVAELDAAISLSSSGIGPITLPMTLVGPGHYRASDATFPLAGSWTLKLTVRTSAIDEQEAFATVPVH